MQGERPCFPPSLLRRFPPALEVRIPVVGVSGILVRSTSFSFSYVHSCSLSRHYGEALIVLEYTRAPSNVVTWSPRSISPPRTGSPPSAPALVLVVSNAHLRRLTEAIVYTGTKICWSRCT